jgi:5-methylcytosine-specific restriction endonuclease McrA
LLIFRKAVALSNQTATRSGDGEPSRHISREVRQRVWQRYGGQCVDCGAREYLEFDHIIPVAKGGSNADANIQLLCRRCNLKKSDHI